MNHKSSKKLLELRERIIIRAFTRAKEFRDVFGAAGPNHHGIWHYWSCWKGFSSVISLVCKEMSQTSYFGRIWRKDWKILMMAKVAIWWSRSGAGKVQILQFFGIFLPIVVQFNTCELRVYVHTYFLKLKIFLNWAIRFIIHHHFLTAYKECFSDCVCL